MAKLRFCWRQRWNTNLILITDHKMKLPSLLAIIADNFLSVTKSKLITNKLRWLFCSTCIWKDQKWFWPHKYINVLLFGFWVSRQWRVALFSTSKYKRENKDTRLNNHFITWLLKIQSRIQQSTEITYLRKMARLTWSLWSQNEIESKDESSFYSRWRQHTNREF